MITYKNITDVEVLEQASENTKVLVNEGGELMQAPYSNFEDKMSNAEVLEKIPENAMALVNDGGKLKQVACKEMGGAFVVNFGTNMDTGAFTCDKTYAEILEAAKTSAVIGIAVGVEDTVTRVIHLHFYGVDSEFGAVFDWLEIGFNEDGEVFDVAGHMFVGIKPDDSIWMTNVRFNPPV